MNSKSSLPITVLIVDSDTVLTFGIARQSRQPMSTLQINSGSNPKLFFRMFLDEVVRMIIKFSFALRRAKRVRLFVVFREELGLFVFNDGAANEIGIRIHCFSLGKSLVSWE